MPISSLLATAPKKELQKFNDKMNRDELSANYISFTGAPRKHPYDPSRLLLVLDPFSQHTSFYDFETGDIAYAEEINTIVTPEGESVTMVRIWVKKGCIGIHCSPFQVADTRF
ncbi:MAG: inorganic pyrophosphatase Ppa [Deltaproteobacteria bacterium]